MRPNRPSDMLNEKLAVTRTIAEHVGECRVRLAMYVARPNHGPVVNLLAPRSVGHQFRFGASPSRT